MAWGYQKVIGAPAPNFWSILIPTAQSAVETAHWTSMWNWNAGNVTTAHPDKDPWIDLGDLGQGQARGLKFKAYANLGAGCADMLAFLRQHAPGCFAAARVGDVGAYTNALRAANYAGADDGSLYANYAAGIMSYANMYANVKPVPYSPGISPLLAFGIGLGVVGGATAAAWYAFPTETKKLLGIGEGSRNPLEDDEADEDEADEDDDATSERASEPQPTEVQQLMFDRNAGWTPTRAKSWLRRHKPYHAGKITLTTNYVRARQTPPERFKSDSFRTITFGDEDKGIKAVIGKRA